MLRLLELINLPEPQRVTVTFCEPEEDWLAAEFMNSRAAGVRERVSLKAVHPILTKIPSSLADIIIAEGLHAYPSQSIGFL